MMLSIIVMVLSILVVVLITWQIYTLIDIRKIKKEVEAKRQLVFFESNRNMYLSTEALADFYYSLLIKENIENLNFKYLNYRDRKSVV